MIVGPRGMTDLRLTECWITECTTRIIQRDQLGMVIVVSTYTHKTRFIARYHVQCYYPTAQKSFAKSKTRKMGHSHTVVLT